MMGNKLYGQGFNEGGDFPTYSEGKCTKEYTLWLSMITRCYSKKNLERRGTYIDCEVSENFKNFQFFAKWCQNQKGFGLEGWQIDKDILCTGTGSSIYSEDTCCFVPNCINMYFLKDRRVCVNYHKKSKLWQANISINNKTKYIGSSKVYEEALNMYNSYKLLVVKDLLVKYENQLEDKVVNKILDILGE